MGFNSGFKGLKWSILCNELMQDTLLRNVRDGVSVICTTGSLSNFFFVALRPNAGHGLLILEVFYITHNDAPQSVGLLWTSDQLVAPDNTQLTTDKHTCPRWDSNPRSQQTSSLRPCGHWNRHSLTYPFQIQFFMFSLTFLMSPFGSVNVVSHVTLPWNVRNFHLWLNPTTCSSQELTLSDVFFRDLEQLAGGCDNSYV